MSQTIKLTLPDKLYQSILRNAQATNQSVEEVVLTALEIYFSSHDELPLDGSSSMLGGQDFGKAPTRTRN